MIFSDFSKSQINYTTCATCLFWGFFGFLLFLSFIFFYFFSRWFLVFVLVFVTLMTIFVFVTGKQCKHSAMSRLRPYTTTQLIKHDLIVSSSRDADRNGCYKTLQWRTAAESGGMEWWWRAGAPRRDRDARIKSSQIPIHRSISW